jgi:hypothetical protein
MMAREAEGCERSGTPSMPRPPTFAATAMTQMLDLVPSGADTILVREASQ